MKPQVVGGLAGSRGPAVGARRRAARESERRDGPPDWAEVEAPECGRTEKDIPRSGPRDSPGSRGRAPGAYLWGRRTPPCFLAKSGPRRMRSRSRISAGPLRWSSRTCCSEAVMPHYSTLGGRRDRCCDRRGVEPGDGANRFWAGSKVAPMTGRARPPELRNDRAPSSSQMGARYGHGAAGASCGRMVTLRLRGQTAQYGSTDFQNEFADWLLMRDVKFLIIYRPRPPEPGVEHRRGKQKRRRADTVIPQRPWIS